TVIIFSIGGNDSAYLIKEKRNRVPIDRFEKNINKLISEARKYTKDIVFVGITPVDKERTSPIPWDTNKIYNNIYIERYNSALKTICQKEKVKFVDLYAKLIKMDYKKLLEDGLHPNSKGHEWMAKKIMDSIF
ncbi:MAG TPA: SGNH/GDSL hydrolase family protein, partial [Candidatus Moranbacteria bacterium]|nr:SGNH/GDSL hydrolase family protein [Candidatus Moranbacteria bacterium]